MALTTDEQIEALEALKAGVQSIKDNDKPGAFGHLDVVRDLLRGSIREDMGSTGTREGMRQWTGAVRTNVQKSRDIADLIGDTAMRDEADAILEGLPQA